MKILFEDLTKAIFKLTTQPEEAFEITWGDTLNAIAKIIDLTILVTDTIEKNEDIEIVFPPDDTRSIAIEQFIHTLFEQLIEEEIIE